VANHLVTGVILGNEGGEVVKGGVRGTGATVETGGSASAGGSAEVWASRDLDKAVVSTGAGEMAMTTERGTGKVVSAVGRTEGSADVQRRGARRQTIRPSSSAPALQVGTAPAVLADRGGDFRQLATVLHGQQAATEPDRKRSPQRRHSPPRQQRQRQRRVAGARKRRRSDSAPPPAPGRSGVDEWGDRVWVRALGPFGQLRLGPAVAERLGSGGSAGVNAAGDAVWVRVGGPYEEMAMAAAAGGHGGVDEQEGLGQAHFE
jgi:hypothetical protein